MARDTFYTGIDLGTSKISTLVAKVGGEGDLQVLGIGISQAEGIEKGMVTDVPAATEAIRASVDEACRYIGRSPSPAHIAISGAHITCRNVQVSMPASGQGAKPVTREDVRGLVRAAYAETDPDMENLHIITREFIVDGLRGVRNPVGLDAEEVCLEATVVAGNSIAIQNTHKAVEKAGMVVDSLVISALASADSVLTEDEKELGVVLLDIGAGTTDVAVFKTGKLIHICTIPVGGHQVSKDLSIALGVPYEYAEELKLRWGCVLPEMVDASEEVLLPTMHGTGHKSFKRVDLCSPIYERIVETLHLVVMRLRQAGMERLPAAGVVLTGGTATMAGMVDLAKRAFHCPVRIGMPRELEGLPEEMHSPAFGASVGILLWSVRHHGEVRSYAARRSEALAGYKTVFTRLSSSTNARLKTAGHKFSAEFKKIYA